MPTAAGVEYACASPRREARRNVLWGLLRGGAGRPVPLASLAAWTGIAERREIRALLFRMQRDGWVNGEIEPFALPSAPLDAALSEALASYSGGAALLADAAGLPVAFAGCERTRAGHLALTAAALYPVIRAARATSEQGMVAPIVESVRDREGAEFVLRALYVGSLRFHLLVSRDAAGASDERAGAFVRLAALIGRRYLGSC